MRPDPLGHDDIRTRITQRVRPPSRVLKEERLLHPGERAARPEPAIPPLRDDALITATRKLNEALSDLARAIGEDGHGTIAEGDRQNLAKFLTISRARLDNLVARLRSAGKS